MARGRKEARCDGHGSNPSVELANNIAETPSKVREQESKREGADDASRLREVLLVISRGPNQCHRHSLHPHRSHSQYLY